MEERSEMMEKERKGKIEVMQREGSRRRERG